MYHHVPPTCTRGIIIDNSLAVRNWYDRTVGSAGARRGSMLAFSRAFTHSNPFTGKIHTNRSQGHTNKQTARARAPFTLLIARCFLIPTHRGASP